MRIGCGPEVITPSKVINTWLLFGLDEPQIMQVQMVRGSGLQILRARCAWMCFHVSRKCLTPGPLVTPNLGCQRHFLECPVKITMWKEMGGIEGRRQGRRASELGMMSKRTQLVSLTTSTTICHQPSHGKIYSILVLKNGFENV